METAFTTPVHAREETVWKILMDKVQNPQKYVPGIRECRILDTFPGGLLREVSTGSVTFRERVSIDADIGEVTFTLIDHPLFSGTVINRAGGTSRQSPVAPTMLTFIVDWTRREGSSGTAELQEIAAGIRRAALAVKDAAEDLDAEWSGDEEAEQGKEAVPEKYRTADEGSVRHDSHGA